MSGFSWRQLASSDDALDRERRTRMATGLTAILLVIALLNLGIATFFHGIGAFTLVLVLTPVLVAVAWQLARKGMPTPAALLIGGVLGLIVPLSAYLTGAVSTWPLAVPLIVLLMIFILPLRWSPYVLLLGCLTLVLLGWLARDFAVRTISDGDLIRDIGFITAAIVAIGLFGALSLAGAERQRQVALEQAAAAERLAGQDPLTGLPNRRAEESFATQAAAAPATGPALSVAMIDVDSFKLINDHLGHEAGDAVLRTIAELVNAETRRVDTLIRHGGDEFLLVMQRIEAGDAAILCSRLRLAVFFHPWAAQLGPQSPKPTLSIGVADTAEFPEWDGLMAAADRRLLAAKTAGRNQVCWTG